MGTAVGLLGVAALVMLFLSPLLVLVLGVEQVWRAELLVHQAEACLVATIRVWLIGAIGVLVVAMFVPGVPLWWVAAYHSVFVLAAAGAWAVFELRVHRAYPQRTLYRVGRDENGVAELVPVRRSRIDAALSRALVPLLVTLAVSATVGCALLS